VYNFGNGHLKGILAYTSTEAIYILHSFPQFPNVSSENFSNFYSVTTDIGNSQMMYGQHMFCVKLKTSDLFTLAGEMSIAFPNVYASRILQQNSNISLLVNNRSISSSPFFSGFSFLTPGGFEFRYFSKSGASNLDIYEQVISPYYQDGFMCETWGRPWEADFCPPSYKYKNLNIDEISIGNYWWTSYYDHSKWAIGITNPIVCYSDMNRMTSQWVRGGGSLCIFNQQLYDYHKSITTKYDSC
jgi:deoxyribonuclease-2